MSTLEQLEIKQEIQLNEVKERMFHLEQQYIHCLDGIDKCFGKIDELKKELNNEILTRKDLRDYCFDVLKMEIENIKLGIKKKPSWEILVCKLCLRYLGDCDKTSFNPTSQFHAICNDCIEKNRILNAM